MARKQINKNLVVALTLCVFLAMVIASVLMLRQLQRADPKRFVAIAESYAEREEWAPAALFYGKAFANSDDPTHLVLQGDMLLEDGDVFNALNCWRQALVNDPELIAAHKRQLSLFLELAALYGGVDRWLPLAESAEAFLDIEVELKDDEEAAARHARGLALVQLASQDASNVSKGLEDLKTASELDPSNLDYSIDYAAACIRHGSSEQGEGILRDLVERFDARGAESARARMVYAKYLGVRRPLETAELSFAEAERLFEESLLMAEGHPESLREAKLEFASFLAQRWADAVRTSPEAAQTQALLDGARNFLEECIEADPDAYDAYLQLAMLYRAGQLYTDVADLCDRRLAQGFSRRGVKATKDKVSAFRLMTIAAEACVMLAVEAGRVDEAGQKAQWLSRAEKYLADANAEFPEHPDVLTQTGRLKLAKGEERAALEDLRRADEYYRARDMINWDNKLLLARLHLKLDEPGAAKSVLEDVQEAAAGQRRTIFSTLYAEAMLRVGELDRALAVAHRVLLHEPDNSEARRVKAAVYSLQGLHDRAGALLDSPLLRALVEARELTLAGDREGAAELQLRALEQNPADVRLVATTVNDLLSLDRAPEARAVLKRALEADPENSFFAKMMVLARKELTDEERGKAMLDIIEAEPDAYQRAWDLMDLYVRRGQLAEALGAINDAERHLRAGDTPFARNATKAQHRALLEAKLRVAAELEEGGAMAEARDSAVEHDVDGAGGKAILGLYHVYRQEMEQAISAFREVVDNQPTDAPSLARLGRCLEIVGRMNEARLFYEKATRVNPNEPAAHRGLAMIAKAHGDTETFERELDACARLIPEDQWVKSQLLARQEDADPQAALQKRRLMLETNPADRSNLYRLAILSEAVDDIAAADGYWETLLARTTSAEDVLVSRSSVAVAAAYFRRTGRPEKSLELVTEYAQSRREVEEKANAQILIAAHHLHQGDTDLVQATLLAAADLAPTFEIVSSVGEFYLRNADRPDEALKWFDRAMQIARAQGLPQLKQVLITRITCLAHRKVYDLERARSYVDEFIAEFPDDAEGHLLSSEVHTRAGQIDEAVAALSAYLKARPNDLYALSQRARHYVSQGLIAQAIEDLETIKRSDVAETGQVSARILLARLHFQAGHRGDWLRELESLAADAPESPVAVEELINAYIRERRFEDADKLATAQINRSGNKRDPRWFFLRSRIALEQDDYGRALDDAKRGAALTGYEPDGLLHLLGVCLRASRPDQGLKFYEQYATGQNVTPALVSRRARLLADTGRLAEAADEFRRAFDLTGGASREVIQAVTGELLGVSAPPDKLLSVFEGSSHSPEVSSANDRILARLYRRAGRTEEAIATLERLIDGAASDHQRTALLVELAESYHAAGDAERARAAYENALRLDGDNWVVLNNLAYVLCDVLGKHSVALPYARRAVAIADTPGTLDTLGWIYVGLGEYALAAAELSRAIRLDPELALAYYHLGEAYRRNGRFVEAKRILREGGVLARKNDEADLAARFEVSVEKAEARESHP